MFRLAEDMIRIDKKKYPELYALATEVFTDNIAVNISNFYENEKIVLPNLLPYLDDDVVKDAENYAEGFIEAKANQLYRDIKDPERNITPDVFNEYLLMKMIRSNTYFIVDIADEEKKENLKSLIKEFVLDYYKEDIAEISDGRKRTGYIRRRNNYIYKLLTNLIFTLEDEESEYGGFLLWDWDYSLFTDYGFEKTLKILRSPLYGCQRGYGPEYVKEMLTVHK